MRWPPAFEADIPNLLRYSYQVTSPADGRYNCLSWAAGETHRLWDPLPDAPGGHYWPATAPREQTTDALIKAFASIGYSECDSPELEAGFEKVALYVDEHGTPCHAARQLPSRHWTSKIGRAEDIQHAALEAVECPDYGKATVYLRRPCS
jgi:hypothetical protein